MNTVNPDLARRAAHRARLLTWRRDLPWGTQRGRRHRPPLDQAPPLLRALATWLDDYDRAWTGRGDDVQRDLRTWADTIENLCNQAHLTAVLTAHQRIQDTEDCACGWTRPGRSHENHIAASVLRGISPAIPPVEH